MISWGISLGPWVLEKTSNITSLRLEFSFENNFMQVFQQASLYPSEVVTDAHICVPCYQNRKRCHLGVWMLLRVFLVVIWCQLNLLFGSYSLNCLPRFLRNQELCVSVLSLLFDPWLWSGWTVHILHGLEFFRLWHLFTSCLVFILADFLHFNKYRNVFFFSACWQHFSFGSPSIGFEGFGIFKQLKEMWLSLFPSFPSLALSYLQVMVYKLWPVIAFKFIVSLLVQTVWSEICINCIWFMMVYDETGFCFSLPSW